MHPVKAVLRSIVRQAVIRSVLRQFASRELKRPFRPLPPLGWVGQVWGYENKSDAAEHPLRSHLVLYEDGKPLGPPHCDFEQLRTRGGGRYSHWGGALIFSTSDNSDPNTNGRSYRFTMARRHYQRLPLPTNFTQGPAVNERMRDTSPEALRRDVEYAIHCGRSFKKWTAQGPEYFQGKSVLELGPGINYGAVLYLACHGARIAVGDRYLARWEEAYHQPFYTLVRDRLRELEPALDLTPLQELLKAHEYTNEVIACYPSAAEDMNHVPDASFDIVFSNAVLEHVSDLRAAALSLYRITRPGGIGFHQVDFRDHRNFDRPLEYLLMDEGEFRRELAFLNYERGNRWRPGECARFFEEAGFQVRSFRGNCFATPEYLRSFLARLRRARRSPYRLIPEQDLHVISGLLQVAKPG